LKPIAKTPALFNSRVPVKIVLLRSRAEQYFSADGDYCGQRSRRGLYSGFLVATYY